MMARQLARLEPAPEPQLPVPREIIGTHPLEIDAGIVLVGSDCHYRPDEGASTAHLALVALTSRFAEESLLRAVILNGDVADFPKISKHARIMWELRLVSAWNSVACDGDRGKA